MVCQPSLEMSSFSQSRNVRVAPSGSPQLFDGRGQKRGRPSRRLRSRGQPIIHPSLYQWGGMWDDGGTFPPQGENQRGRESLLTASSVRAFSSSPGLLSWPVELCSLKGYRFGEDFRIAHAREIGHIYWRPAGSATD